jgi:pimeloyl-ACP methyl ester carboxylesterase
MVRFFSLFYSKTPKIKDAKGNIKLNSIASLEKIMIGGKNQCILIRGHNVNNPLLLLLHGGPGTAEMPLAHRFERDLEKHFTIVNWDQRGAGKSFSRKIPKESMNVKQFISDTHELVLMLKERFNKEKLYLVGHSWGSQLGSLVVHRFPEHFYAYIGVGQVVDLYENERISYQFTLNEARKRNNEKAIKQLEALQPYTGFEFKKLRKQRKWLNKFGGATHAFKSQFSLVKLGLSAPEYSLRDFFKFVRGMLFSLKSIWTDLFEYNLSELITEYKVPVYFFIGRYDYNTPFELSEKFFEQIKAPKKEYIWFENSAHMPNFEEYKKFDELLISKVLPETYK